MISPSWLGTFWVLYPWMNPPPRTGISRESGSVMFRTGPGPLRAAARSAALRSASAARAFAASTLAWASLTRQWSSTPAASGRAARPRRGCPAAYRSSSSASRAARAARTRARFSSASSTAADTGDTPVRCPARCRSRNASAFAAASRSAASRSARSPASAAAIRSSRRRGLQASCGTSSPRRPAPNSSSSAASAAACAATVSAASLARPSSVRFAAFDAEAAIFIPSSATVPSLPMPSRAHSTSTCPKKSPAASGKSPRNRANVT